MEMSDSGGKQSSSLAITEKKPQKAGGCVGIFFQLFHWNRTLTKKKLFSKKLLPPVRSNIASMKFGGEDKQPKLRLIADENSGGFPSLKKNGFSNAENDQKHDIRAPSLVARLMGLESMPAVQRRKPKISPTFASGSEGEDKFLDGSTRFERQELNSDKEPPKNDGRPQKIQKTGLSEKRPIAKIGAEALHLKNMLSRSRKQHHPKLGSPVKSPKSLSGRHTSRLIGAASKILEPGLQRSRARGTLTYPIASNRPIKHDRFQEETTKISPEEFYNSSYYPSIAATPPIVSKSCSHTSDCRHDVEEHQSEFLSHGTHYANPCGQVSERCIQRQFIFYQEPDVDKGKSLPASARRKFNAKDFPDSSSHIHPPKREGQDNWQLNSQQCKLGKCMNYSADSSSGLEQKAHMHNLTCQGRDRTHQKSKLSSLHTNKVPAISNATYETKGVVNQSFSSQNHSRMPAKIGSCKYHTERRTGIRRKDSTSSVQNKGQTNICKQHACSGTVCSSSRTNTCSNGIMRREAIAGNFVDHPQLGSKLNQVGEQSKSCSRIKKTFSPSVKDKTRNCSLQDSNQGQVDDSRPRNAVQKSSVFQKDSRSTSESQCPLSGDALSALLEQKLKELMNQDEDELVKGGSTPKKTTAMILQELISALTTGQSALGDKAAQSNSNSSYSGHDPLISKVDTSTSFKAEPKQTSTLVRNDHDDKERLSPGSVLEASFSNDSCLTSSFGDGSFAGNKIMDESISSSHNELNSSELDANVLDSETSLSIANDSTQTVTLLNNVSAVLCNFNLADRSLKGTKLVHAKEVLLNAELMLGNAEDKFSVSHFLLSELETLASIIWMSISSICVWNRHNEFAFDSTIEYLDSRYNQLFKCGFATWSRAALQMDGEILIQEIIKEIKRWNTFSGMIPDDLIEWDMSHSLGKWTDFEIEAFETGVEIDGDIIQLIIDEIVLDLWK